MIRKEKGKNTRRNIWHLEIMNEKEETRKKGNAKANKTNSKIIFSHSNSKSEQKVKKEKNID